MKKCRKCGEIKPLDEFVKNKNCKDGHENTCKECRKKRKKETDKLYYIEKIQITKKCDCCGKDYKASRNNQSRNLCKSCSQKGENNSMYDKHLSKENHWNWNPNLTDKEREDNRDFLEYEEWRTQVYQKDNYTCQCCGEHSGKLNAHHKDGYNWCVERRTDITNGATLCEDCHKEFHHIYGYGDNTEEQYNEFINNKDKDNEEVG